MTPTWHFAVLCSFAGAKLVVALASIALARRVRASRIAIEALACRVDELSMRLRAFETHESKGTHISSTSSPQGVARRSGKRRIDPASRPLAAGPTLIAVPSLATLGSEATAIEAAGELSRRYGAIWALFDSGVTASAISATTGHPIGQVELILGLRRTSESAVAGEAQGALTHAR